MRSFLIALIMCLAIPAHAQDWIASDFCTVTEPTIHEDMLAPKTMETLAIKAWGIPNSLGKHWKITSLKGRVPHLWGTMDSNNLLILDLPDTVMTDIHEARVITIGSDYTVNSHADIRKGPDRGDRVLALGIPREIIPGEAIG